MGRLASSGISIMILFGRKVEVEVAGLKISAVKIAFEIERKSDQTPVSGFVELWNLSKEHESLIYERGKTARLIAGYDNSMGVIYDGAVERIVRSRSSLSRITRLELTGKVSAPDKLGAVVSRTWAGKTKVRSIIKDIVEKDLKLEVGPLDAISPDAVLDNFSWTGGGIQGLKSVCATQGVRWFDDDGVIRFNRLGMEQADLAEIQLSKETGLIGRPSVTDDGVQATSLQFHHRAYAGKRTEKGGRLNAIILSLIHI